MEKIRKSVLEVNDCRYYLVNGKYVPSVTTILSWYKRDIIKAWQDRVGIEEANKIKNRAATFGTKMHDNLENYIRIKWIENGDTKPLIEKIKKHPLNYAAFRKIQIILDKNLDSVIQLETQLESSVLKTAGRCDLIGIWNGIPSIIDFKTSRYEKDKDSIETYFMQTTAYSIMLQEMFGTKIEQVVILFASQNEIHNKMFIEDRKNYVKQLGEVINSYYKENKMELNYVNQNY